MSHFQRMVVIPQTEYLQLTTLQEAKQPLAQQFFTAQQAYEDAGEIQDPYTRLVMRSENLDRMKALKDQMRNYINLATPKPYRSRAERLFSVLEPHMKWNEKGELIDPKTNQPIVSSQISDLIQYAVSDRRRNISPKGWSYFVNELRDRNVPQMLLNLHTLDELSGVKRERSPSIPKRVPKRVGKSAIPISEPRLSRSRYPSIATREKHKRDIKIPSRIRDDFLVSYK